MKRFYRPIGHALGFCDGGMNECFRDFTFDEGIPLEDIEAEIEECGDIFDCWPEETLMIHDLLKHGSYQDKEGAFNPNRFIQFFERLSILCSFYLYREPGILWRQSIRLHVSWRDFTIFNLHWSQKLVNPYFRDETSLHEQLSLSILDSEKIKWGMKRVSQP